jgi:hypothetical protein
MIHAVLVLFCTEAAFLCRSHGLDSRLRYAPNADLLARKHRCAVEPRLYITKDSLALSEMLQESFGSQTIAAW